MWYIQLSVNKYVAVNSINLMFACSINIDGCLYVSCVNSWHMKSMHVLQIWRKGPVIGLSFLVARLTNVT